MDLTRNTTTEQGRNNGTVSSLVRFFARFLECQEPWDERNLTFFVDCLELYQGFCDWCRLELGQVPESKAEFLRVLRLVHPRVRVWKGWREGKERTEFLGIRFSGYFPPRPERTLAGTLRYRMWNPKLPARRAGG